MRKLAEFMKVEGFRSLELVTDSWSVKLGGGEKSTESAERDEMPKLGQEEARSTTVEPDKLARANKEAVEEVLPFGSPAKGKIFEVRSPLIGRFIAGLDDGAPYVTIGRRVNKGDVLCVIDTGEFHNEITSDIEGDVVEIVVADGDGLEYDQIMFKIMSR